MQNVFIFLLIFLAPFNLFLKGFESGAYVNGIFVDYLMVKVYLVEIVALMFLVWNLVNLKISELKNITKFFKKNKYLFLIGLLLLARQFFTPKPIISIWQFIRFAEFTLLGFFLWKSKIKINNKVIKWALVSTIVFQSLLGLIQFYQQKPLLPYQFLGETQFTRSINISKIDFKSIQKIPPHGTTAHPNILAGIIVVYGIILLEILEKENKLSLALITAISLFIFLTQSYSAILALALFLIIKTFPKIKKYQWKIFLVSMILIPTIIALGQNSFPKNTSMTRRVELNKQAVQMFFNKPLLGVGMGQFTNNLDQKSGEVVRFIQPTHHAGLLWLTETGLLGITFIILIIKLFKQKIKYVWIIPLIPLIALDHYLLTQWVGVWLILLVFFRLSPRE